ncbi:MAG: hypothetical protein IJ584_07955, partial [Bacteroidales bacterium]|nr:hypothetical protein [Bacteroidales bacterium]
SWIKNNRKNLRFRLELFPTIENWPSHRKDFHDRTIITNNIWIGSEAGFDLLIPDRTMSTSTRVTKSTKTHGLYLGFGEEAANWLDKAYDDLIEDAKRSLRKNHFSTENKLLLDYDG